MQPKVRKRGSESSTTGPRTHSQQDLRCPGSVLPSPSRKEVKSIRAFVLPTTLTLSPPVLMACANAALCQAASNPRDIPRVQKELKPYESPREVPPSRGNLREPAPVAEDVVVLQRLMRIVVEVERASVSPHPSVLHRKYGELIAVVNENAFAGGYAEGEWFQAVLKAAESVESRRKVAGALSVMQLRGTGSFWSKLWSALRRRCAEKALCMVRQISDTPKRSPQRKELFSRLALLISMDSELGQGFMSNGFDAGKKAFVREPDLAEASRLLHALGAPLESVPVPVRQRVRGERLGFLW